MTEVNTKYDVTKKKRLDTPVFNTGTEVGTKYDVGTDVDPASKVGSAYTSSGQGTYGTGTEVGTKHDVGSGIDPMSTLPSREISDSWLNEQLRAGMPKYVHPTAEEWDPQRGPDPANYFRDAQKEGKVGAGVSVEEWLM